MSEQEEIIKKIVENTNKMKHLAFESAEYVKKMNFNSNEEELEIAKSLVEINKKIIDTLSDHNEYLKKRLDNFN